MSNNSDVSNKPESGQSVSGDPIIDLLDHAGKRGVVSLRPYLWTLVFIVAILALVISRGLDWQTAGFGALVVLSLLIVLFVIKQIIDAPHKEIRTLATTAMWFFMILFAVSITLFLSSAFFGKPLDFRPLPNKSADSGIAVINNFYKCIDKRDYKAAWELIHRRRKKEILKHNPDFNVNEFAKAYETTRIHQFLQIDPVPRQKDMESVDRVYRVSFAVSDELPINTLYTASRTMLVSTWFSNPLSDRKRFIDQVMNDVKSQFVVPAESEPQIVNFVMSRRFSSLFKPEIIYDIGREMNLAERKDKPSPHTVWRYFIQEIHLQEEQPGVWKISAGLYPQLVNAVYEEGVSAP